MEDTIRRFSPLAGIAFVLMIPIGFAIEGGTPATDDPAAEIQQFYLDNDAKVIVGAFFIMMAAVALLVFGAALRDRIADAGARLLASVAFGGTIFGASAIAADSALRFSLAESADKLDAASLHSIFALFNTFFYPIHAGVAVFVAATSLAALDSKMLPTWLSGIGVLAAVLLLVPVAAVTLTGLLIGMVWVLITSILLFRRGAPSVAG